MKVSPYKNTMMEVSDFPAIVNVEVYRGNCPCRCVHCPVGVVPPNERKRSFGEGEIELDLFEKIAYEIRSHPDSALRIHSTGEPLLWRSFPDALKILKDTGIRSWLFTSAVTRDRSLLKAICESISIVEVSVNSITAEDYLATKGVDAFSLVIENIRYMYGVMVKNRSGRLIVSRVESDHMDGDNQFVDYWKSSGLVDDAFIRSRHTYNELLPELACAPLSPVKTGPCLVHWARFNIGLNGQAIVCFNELFKSSIDPSLILGNIMEESISDVWMGPKLTALRHAELTGDYSRLSRPDALPCRNCTHSQPLLGTERKTSEYQLQQTGSMNDQTLSRVS